MLARANLAASSRVFSVPPYIKNHLPIVRIHVLRTLSSRNTHDPLALAVASNATWVTLLARHVSRWAAETCSTLAKGSEWSTNFKWESLSKMSLQVNILHPFVWATQRLSHRILHRFEFVWVRVSSPAAQQFLGLVHVCVVIIVGTQTRKHSNHYAILRFWVRIWAF